MPEPKRRVPGWIVISALIGALGTIILSLASNDLHDYLVAKYGSGYTMQFAVVGLGWPYLPHVLFIVAVVGLWLWSQSAPPERIVEQIVYRAPEPTETQREITAAAAARTTWKGAIWKWRRGHAAPCCPMDGHGEQQLVFESGDGVHPTMPRYGPAFDMRYQLKCVYSDNNSDEHFVVLAGSEPSGVLDEQLYRGIATEAEARLRG